MFRLEWAINSESKSQHSCLMKTSHHARPLLGCLFSSQCFQPYFPKFRLLREPNYDPPPHNISNVHGFFLVVGSF